jgi:maltooligosyltrehalose synthase
MVYTRWTLPNTAHENALKTFVASVLEPGGSNPFLRDFAAFQRSIGQRGMVNGLAQTLIKIISPGIPDFYQGSELWDLRLVDPDNRQPVDFAKRVSMLAQAIRSKCVPSRRFGARLGGRSHQTLCHLEGTEFSSRAAGALFERRFRRIEN